MIEQMIENLISEGKITQIEIDRRVVEHRASLPSDSTQTDLESLKRRQDETENVILALLLGGM